MFKFLILIFMLIFNQFAYNVSGQNCDIPEMGTEFQHGFYELGEVEPKFVGKLKDCETKNILSMAITDGDNKYWNATLIDRVLSVFTLEKFKDYELEMSSNELILDIDFKCSSGQKRLQIYVTIKNVNSYTPEFGQEQYFIKIPTPLPKGFDVSLVMDEEILVTDYDLYDNITFTLNGTTLFSAESSQLTNKTYRARLITATQITDLENDLTFDLIATDNSGKFDKASVTISTDHNNKFVEKLKFNEPIYEGRLYENFTLDMPTIFIETDLTGEIQLELIGEYKENFLLIKSDDNEINVLTKDLENSKIFKELFVKMLLKAEIEGQTEKTVIFLHVITSRERSPIFEKNFYEFTKLNGVIQLQEETYFEDVEVSYSGNDWELFDIVKNGRKISFQLKEEVEVPNKDPLIFDVLAKRPNGLSATTSVLINLQSKPPTSIIGTEKPFYEFIYTQDEEFQKVSIELVNYNQEDIEISLAGQDAKFFESQFSKTEGKLLISLNDSYSIDFSVKKLVFALQIEEHQVPIFVFLEPKIIKFEESLYQGHVTNDLEVQIGLIKLQNTIFYDDISIILSGLSADLIELKKTFGGFEVNLKDSVTVDELLLQSYLLFTVTAISNGMVFAETHVILEVNVYINKEKLSFSKSTYFGSLDNGMNLEMENLIVEAESFEFGFELKGSDASFFNYSVEGNEITLTSNSSLDFPVGSFWNRTILKFEAVVTLSYIIAVTNVIVTLPPIGKEKYLEFEKNLYLVTVDNLDGEEIFLKADNYDSSVEFHIEGRDYKYFSIISIKNRVKIELKSMSSKNESSICMFEIHATRDDFVPAITHVIVDLQISVDHIKGFHFEMPYYRGILTENDIVQMAPIKILPGIGGLEFELAEVDSENFDIAYDEKYLNLLAKTPIQQKNFYVFLIKAWKVGGTSTSATIIIERIKKEKLPDFDRIVYEGEVTENSFKSPTISYPIPHDVQIKLIEGNSSMFELVQSEYFSIRPTENLFDKSLWKNNPFLSFYIIATKNGFESSYAFIIIRGFKVNSDDCSFNPNPEDPQQPYFKTGYYSFVITEDAEEIIGSLSAYLDDSQGQIIYGLENLSSDLQGKLSIDPDNGKISVRKGIEMGQYSFIGIATNILHSKSATTKILLTVKRSSCDIKIEHVEKSLEILFLSENFEHNQIMPSEIGDCEFEIESVRPNYFKSLFSIDKTTHFLRSKEFDREHRVFAGHSLPQFQIKLKLDCGFNESFSVARNKREVYPNMIVSDPIPYSIDTMHLNIIIVDENDNAPIFTLPKTKQYLVGYPEPNLAIQMMPPYLMNVMAVDIDEGVNAEITFRLNSNIHFEIDPKSGVIYPLKDAMKNVSEVKLMVTAFDKFGTNGSLSSYVDITVKKFNKRHVGVLKINNPDLTNMEQLVSDIREKTNLNLFYINYAAVPSEDYDENSKNNEGFYRHEFQRQSEAPKETLVKMFIYAFDKSDNLQTADTLREIFTNSDLSYDIDDLVPLQYSLDAVDTPWFISTIVLGVLLVLFLITLGFVLFYIQKCRKDLRRSSDTQKNLQDDFFKNSPVDSPVPILKHAPKNSADEIEIIGSVTEENLQLAKSLEQILKSAKSPDSPQQNHQDSPNGDKKKNNVTFNELVERIEVIADVENENEHVSKTSYDQRL